MRAIDLATKLAACPPSASVRIEIGGLVGDYLVTDAYSVPASDDGEYPAALHIVISPPRTAHALHEHTMACVARGGGCKPGEPCGS